LTNPTRIASAQRQLRAVLGLDGVVAYFDPYLEAEAMGCQVNWNPDGASSTLQPVNADAASLPGELPSPGQIVQRGRISVACDVLRRLKMMLMGEPALMVAVSGPMLLTELLVGSQADERSRSERVEVSAEVTNAVSKAFLEAGANVIFIREEGEAIHDAERWAEMLSPIVNVIRFYEAMPVVLFSGQAPEEAMTELNANSDGAICPVELGEISKEFSQAAISASYMPESCWSSEQQRSQIDESLRELSSERTVHVLTTRGDVPANLDVKSAAAAFSELRKISRVT
jgi:hypothetical protein